MFPFDKERQASRFEPAQSTFPESPNPYNLLARLYLEHLELAKAIEAIEQSLQPDPDGSRKRNEAAQLFRPVQDDDQMRRRGLGHAFIDHDEQLSVGPDVVYTVVRRVGEERTRGSQLELFLLDFHVDDHQVVAGQIEELGAVSSPPRAGSTIRRDLAFPGGM